MTIAPPRAPHAADAAAPAPSLPGSVDAPAPVVVRTPRARAAAFVELTKPRIMVLLLITCVAAMFCAAQGMPSLGLLGVTALGLALSSGGASALNHVVDRDIDALMKRTARRPVVTGMVSAREGTVFGVALMAAAGVLLWTQVNPLTALLALGGGLFYVLGYTMVLKRSTAQNIVIGGAAGAAPPLVGWAAIENGLGIVPLVMFAVIFLWTPPHFWALALLIREEYARASVPMLPVVAGDRATAWQILAYSVVLTAATVLPVATGHFGVVYLVATLALGGRLIQKGMVLRREIEREAAQRTEAELAPGPDGRHPALVVPGTSAHAAAKGMFLYSMGYLALLFVAVVLDKTLLSVPLPLPL